MSTLPSGWAQATTDALFTFVTSGSRGWARYYSDEGAPFIRIGNLQRGSITPDLADLQRVSPPVGAEGVRTQVESDDILISITADLGRVALMADVGETTYINQHVALARPVKAINPRYVAWYLSSDTAQRQWGKQQRGVTRLGLGLEDIRSVEVPIAPLAEQERIVAAIEEQFSRLDAGAAILERVRRNLKHMRATVLYAGVTGRLVDQEPGEGSGADLLASIKLDDRRTSRRRENLVTPMPLLPQSWATARWSAVGWSQNGRAFPSADYAKEGVRLLRPGNLYASGQVGWTAANTRALPEHYAREFPDYIVGPNEIVMNLTAQSLKDEFLGRVCMTAPQDEPVLLNQRIARLTPAGMNPRFVFYVLKSPIFRRFVDQLNTGSLIQHMFTSQLDQFILPVPPRGDQDRIVERIEQYLTSLDHVEYVLYGTGKQMSALRAAVLSAAFSGRLVPQDPDDEPASALVERIASERTSSNGHKRGRSRKTRLLRDEVTA